jgi:hypothetical protein
MRLPTTRVHRARNVASKSTIRSKLLGDPRIVALIEAHHLEDAKLYRHVRDVVYPRQVAQYGAALEHDLAALRARLPAPQRRVVARALASIKRGMVYKPLARRPLLTRNGSRIP